ncbi:thioredoxin family protein [Thermosphaera chiliense]|uniref:Thioredoxin family protein n=1 Tax=Thermosphaera chiliense TaxID=3402707 RepID=A0A7M1UP20_9CREN|nr:thioredoxin family protein [Thermosphaera aggregans]QOR94018.1 thioredoxin family protein [Thermosphaera aggregans]
MSGLFDQETESELKNIFAKWPRNLKDTLIIDEDRHEGPHSHENPLDHCHTCDDAVMLVNELARISEGKLRFNIMKKAEAKEYKPRYLPSFIYDTPSRNVRYYGLPSGQEFAPFIFVHEYIATNALKLPKEVIEEVEAIDAPLHIKVFVTPECPYCPLVVDFANQVGLINPNIIVETIEAMENPIEADYYGVQYVPFVAITRVEDYYRYGAKPVEVIPGYLPPEEAVKVISRAARKLKRS